MTTPSNKVLAHGLPDIVPVAGPAPPYDIDSDRYVNTPLRLLSRSRLNALLCACLTALAMFATRPLLEMGTTDDWSYAKTALDLVRTGHVVYNGWATAMLGWQIFWGALFIKLFGFSFLTLRLSTLPFAIGAAYLLHRICIRVGLSERYALLATLTIVLSPLFLPLADSFMTDVPGFFWLLVAFYACLRALETPNFRPCVAWLVFATATNVVAGSARQIVWLGALVMVPSTAWLLRRRRGVLPVAFLLWVGSLITMEACMRWFQAQPYSIPEKIIAGHFALSLLPHVVQQVRDSILTVLLLSVPVLAGYLFVLQSVSKKTFASLCAAGLLFFAIRFGTLGARALAPWLPYVVSPYGVGGSGSWENLGEKVIVLAPWARALITAAMVVSASAWLANWLPSLGLLQSQSSKPLAAPPEPTPLRVNWLALFGPFSLAYFALLLPRATFGIAVDRYLLPLLAIFVIAVLRSYKNSFCRYPPALCFAVLGLFSLYSVAATHDYFATGRARLAAATEVEARGIPRTQIQGGWEYDGWTQISAAGFIDDPRLVVPAGAYQPIFRSAKLPKACRFEFSQFTPAIDPKYFVVFSPQPCLASSQFSAVEIQSWLPPFHRKIEVQTLPLSR